MGDKPWLKMRRERAIEREREQRIKTNQQTNKNIYIVAACIVISTDCSCFNAYLYNKMYSTLTDKNHTETHIQTYASIGKS